MRLLGGVSPLLRAGEIWGVSRIWTPAALFAAGQQGWFYDNQDDATLFQDSDGTISAGLEDTIGLQLDLSGNGNHRSQTDPAKRPVLSARYNKLVGTEALSTQSVSVQADEYNLTFSGDGSITLSGAATGTITAPGKVFTASTGTLTLTVSGTVTQAQLVPLQDSELQYQWVVSTTDYDGDKSKFPRYLLYNGTSCMVSAAIDLTGGDKVTTFSGVRKFDDRGFVLEFSASSVNNAGAFYTSTGTATNLEGAGWGVLARGTTSISGAQAAYSGADYPEPLTSIVRGEHEITPPLTRLYVDGDLVEESTADKGAGNFGNYPIYFGARAGSSFFFEGREYSSVGVADVLSESSAEETERFMLRRTPQKQASTSLVFSDSSEPILTLSHPRTSTFASVNIQTDAQQMQVDAYNDIYGTFPSFAALGVYIDGVYNQSIEPTASGSSSHNINLPAGDKTVSIVNGLQSRPSLNSPPIGTFVTGFSTEPAASQVELPRTNRLLVYGDSIASGGNASDVPQDAWVLKTRAGVYPRSVALEGWGYRSLHEDASTPTKRADFVSKMAAYGPAEIWLAIGTNDYGLDKWSSVDFGAAYAALLDDLKSALPDVHIYCQTPIVRSDESANALGSALTDYRDEISSAASAKSSFCSLVDGTAIMTTASLEDGVHPTTAGHALYADYVLGVVSP